MKQTVKRLLKSTLRLVGYDINGISYLRQHITAYRLMEMFRQWGIETVIDVGANVGQYRDYLRNEVGFSGTIWSFEPLQELCKEMERRRGRDRRWFIENAALGAASGSRPFNVAKDTRFSSFLHPSTTVIDKFEDLNDTVERRVIEVCTLDDMAQRAPFPLQTSRVFLKLDTQGLDWEVIAGSKKTLAAIIGVQTEISVLPIYEGMRDFCDSVSKFREVGFYPVSFDPVSKDAHGRAIEFDCVLVRDLAPPVVYPATSAR